MSNFEKEMKFQMYDGEIMYKIILLMKEYNMTTREKMKGMLAQSHSNPKDEQLTASPKNRSEVGGCSTVKLQKARRLMINNVA